MLSSGSARSGRCRRTGPGRHRRGRGTVAAVALRLTVDTDTWRANVDHVVRHCPGLVPVVKGNGYGFGRAELARIAARLADTIAFGTVHELDHVPGGITPVVLTPTWQPPVDTVPILTVGLDRPRPRPGGLARPGARQAGVVGPPLRHDDRGARAPSRRRPGRPGWTSSASASTRRWPAPTTSTSTTSPCGSASWPTTTRCGSATSRCPPTTTSSTAGRSAASASAWAPRCGTPTSGPCTSTPTCSTSDPCGPANAPVTASSPCPPTAAS